MRSPPGRCHASTCGGKGARSERGGIPFRRMSRTGTRSGRCTRPDGCSESVTRRLSKDKNSKTKKKVLRWTRTVIPVATVSRT